MTTLLTPTAARLLRIERHLRTRGAVVTAEVLMADLQCSLPTLKRDLSTMRSDLGAVIVYDRFSGRYELRNRETWPGVLVMLCREAALA